jgi:hypothetical protein
MSTKTKTYESLSSRDLFAAFIVSYRRNERAYTSKHGRMRDRNGHVILQGGLVNSLNTHSTVLQSMRMCCPSLFTRLVLVHCSVMTASAFCILRKRRQVFFELLNTRIGGGRLSTRVCWITVGPPTAVLATVAIYNGGVGCAWVAFCTHLSDVQVPFSSCVLCCQGAWRYWSGCVRHYILIVCFIFAIDIDLIKVSGRT